MKTKAEELDARFDRGEDVLAPIFYITLAVVLPSVAE